MSILNYVILLPEIWVCAVGVALLLADLVTPVQKKELLGFTAAAGLLPAFPVILGISKFTGAVVLPGFAFDNFSTFFKFAVLFAAFVVILLSINYPGLATPRKGAYYSLVVFSAAAMMFLASAADLLMIYLSIEFLGLTSYVLAGFMRNDVKSVEGSVKYFLLGIFSGAIMLYGMSLVYGLTGSLDLSVIRERAITAGAGGTLFAIAAVFIIVGFGFKIALVPFHMWAPDAYEGAPTPITAYLSVASKAAGVAVLMRTFMTALPAPAVLFSVLSVLTMTVANVIALSQRNIKRLLAYSSISHVGYIMIGFVAGDALGTEGVLIYVLTYLFMNLGAFAVVVAVSNSTGTDDIDGYAGLSRKSPFLSGLLAVFLLSLAGIPPTAGFIGKFYVFGAAIKTGYVWLAIAGIINSVIAVYYYFNIVHKMYFKMSPEETDLSTSATLKIVLASLGAIVFIIGIFPQYFMEFIRHSVNMVK